MIVAPAGPIGADALEVSLGAAEELGIPVRADRDALTERHGHLAGSDADRAGRLRDAILARPTGVWLARGGFGCVRTLAALGADALAALPPVPIWAFSDGTTLLAAWAARGVPAWHAPPLSQLPRLDAPSAARVRAAVHSGTVAPFRQLAPVVPGVASGPLAGGNLCVLASLVGTPWAADLRGALVVLEDVAEPPYKVDRLLTQLRLAGAFDHVAGFVFGQFTGVTPADGALIAALLGELARDLGVPAAAGLPVGHGEANAPLPFGAAGGYRSRLSVDTDGAQLTCERP